MKNKEVNQMNPYRHVRKIMLFLICLVGSIPMMTAASNNADLVQKENQLSSLYSTYFFIANDLAYIDRNTHWEIVDVTDPLNPIVLGQTISIPHNITDAKVVGNIAYLAGGNNGLIVVDLNPDSPTDPIFLSSFGVSSPDLQSYGLDSFYAFKLDVANDVAYVIGNGVFAIDVSVPTAPSFIAVLNDPLVDNILSYDIEVVDDIVYVMNPGDESAGNAGLVTIDVSDPENMTRLGYLPLYGATQLALRNNIAYAFDGQKISVVDVTNPAEPSLLSLYEGDNIVITMIETDSQDNEVMYVTLIDSEIYLLKLDISNPSELIELERTLPTEQWSSVNIYDVRIVGDYFYNHAGALYVHSLNDGATSKSVFSYDTPPPSAQPSYWELFSNEWDSFFIADELAYIDRDTYWDIVDITDLSNLTVLGRTTNIPNGMYDAKVVDDTAYITYRSDEMNIVDINPDYPTEPVVLSNLQISLPLGANLTSGRGIDVVGNIAYWGTDSITTIDISDPNSPTLISTLDVSGENTYSRSLHVQLIDDIAYIVNTDSFYMIDVSDPANLIILGSSTLEPGRMGLGWANEQIHDLIIRDDVVYAISSGNHMSIFDVSNPADITLVSRYAHDDTSTWQGVIYVEEDVSTDGIMYIASIGSAGNNLLKLDVSDPFAPVELETIPLDSSPSPNDTVIVGNTVYYMGDDTPLLTLSLDGDVTTSPTPTVVSPVDPDVTPPVPTMTPTPVITEPIELEVRSGLDDVLLRWQVVDPLEGVLDHYNVYKYQLGTVIVPILASSQLGSHYVDDGDFIDGQAYCYYVEAIDDADEVITSSNINCTTFGELQLVVPHVVLPPDSRGIAVPVTVLNGNGLCPVSQDITLAYDPALVTAVDVQQTAYTAGYRFEASIDQPGRVSIASITGNCDPLAGSGALFNVLFDVVGDAGAVSSLDFMEGITATAIYNSGDNEPTVLRTVNGSLTVGAESTRGDISGDQFINAFDAFLALEIVVGAIEPTLQEAISCDVNGDGSCNTADSSLILCFAAYETWDSCDLTPTTRSKRGQAITTLTKGELSDGKLPILVQGGAAVSGGTVTFTYDPALIQLDGIETANSVIEGWSVTTDEETGLLRVAFADDEPMGSGGTLFTINATPLVEGATVQWAGAQFNDGLGLDWESNLGHTLVYADSAEVVPLSVSVVQQTAWSSVSLVGVFILLLCGLTAVMWRID